MRRAANFFARGGVFSVELLTNLYNLDTMKLVKEQDSYIDVANIIIIDKSQRL